jgi:hypothetical protein
MMFAPLDIPNQTAKLPSANLGEEVWGSSSPQSGKRVVQSVSGAVSLFEIGRAGGKLFPEHCLLSAR